MVVTKGKESRIGAIQKLMEKLGLDDKSLDIKINSILNVTPDDKLSDDQWFNERLYWLLKRQYDMSILNPKSYRISNKPSDK